MNEQHRNPVYSYVNGVWTSHFALHEIVRVHWTVLVSAERVRAKLNELHGGGITLEIKGLARTEADNVALAQKLGWTCNGGQVSRYSTHLVNYENRLGEKGCCGIDLVALRTNNAGGGFCPRKRVPQRELGSVCRQFFDWVKDDYRDGHVHADNRAGGLKVRRDIK